MVNKMLMKTVWYPRPHNFQVQYAHGLESGVNNAITIVPMIMNDEGLGAPASYKAHPENASFAEAAEPNCYPDSRVNLINSSFLFSMTKAALVTDNIEAVRCAYMPIFLSFDDLIANDELSTNDIGDILRLQRESTDRQCYPLWNGVDMKARYGTAVDNLPANVPGLTTDQSIEGVTFDNNVFYNALQYYQNAGKLKNCVGGLKFFTLTRTNPVRRIVVNLRSKSKRIKPFTFAGCMTFVSPADSALQTALSTETTDLAHVSVQARIRFNEWNPEFNMARA